MPKKRKQKDLPKYPSQLLKLALDDIAVINKDERYEIDADEWHMPNKKTCLVCLSGAVLANTLKFNIKNKEVKYIQETIDEIGVDNCIKLGFIDKLRKLELMLVYFEFKNFLKQKNLTIKQRDIIGGVIDKIFKKLRKITPSKYVFDHIFSFKDFKKSHDFYSSIVEDLEYLDKKILGRK